MTPSVSPVLLSVPSSALERRRGMAQEEGRSGLLQQMRSKLSVTRTEEFTGKATTAEPVWLAMAIIGQNMRRTMRRQPDYTYIFL